MDDESDETPVAWPTKSDRLFATGTEWYHNACLNFLADHMGGYILGYKRAADILAEHVMENARYQDTLIYPIVFLYRQYLELCMKQLIRDAAPLLDAPINTSSTHHRLLDLWADCRAILQQALPDQPQPEDWETIGECITEFNAIDPTSTAFRYPTDKQGLPSLPDIRHIGIGNLYEVMGKISAFMDAAQTVLSVYLEQKREWEIYIYRETLDFGETGGE